MRKPVFPTGSARVLPKISCTVWLLAWIFTSPLPPTAKSWAAPVSQGPTGEPFTALLEKFKADGLSPDHLHPLSDPSLQPRYDLVAATLQMHERHLRYHQFLTAKSVSTAKAFLRAHRDILTEAEKTYGVPACLITSVLLVETRLGKVTGRVRVLEILATYALMDDPKERKKVWERLPATAKRHWDRRAFGKRLRQKARWARRELQSLLNIIENNPVLNMHRVKGSIMGAFGWPQFLPSSYLRYGADGDGDGIVDLFTAPDAIFSIARYLHDFGWKEGASRHHQEAVLFHYNHSRPYVRTVLELARRIEESSWARHAR